MTNFFVQNLDQKDTIVINILTIFVKKIRQIRERFKLISLCIYAYPISIMNQHVSKIVFCAKDWKLVEVFGIAQLSTPILKFFFLFCIDKL